MKKKSKCKGLVLIILMFFYGLILAQDLHPLRNVAIHYKNTGELEKFNATIFLIKHMYHHKSITIDWYANNEKLDFNEFDFEDYEEAFQYLESQKATYKYKTTYDEEQVSESFFKKNIDDAFTFWKTKPWAKHYSFSDFCEYILPYRANVEPLEENWRGFWQDKLGDILDSQSLEEDPIELCISVINQLKEYTFVLSRKDAQPTLSSSQMEFRRKGSCPDLANIAILANRAIGVATTFDFTPHFPASSNRHFWNTVIGTDGKHIPFNGNMGYPYSYDANNKRLGKVLRRTFSEQENSLASILPRNKIPGLSLKNPNLKDVTSEYVAVSDVTYQFKNQNTNLVKFINVYNQGKWRILWWGITKKNNTAIFKNMGRNIVYLPSAFNYDTEANPNELEPFPLLLKSDGKTEILKPNFKQLLHGTLSKENQKIAKKIETNSFEFVDGEKVHLMYWDKTWQFSGTYTVENESVKIKNTPSNALFKLISENPDDFERIFTINPKTYQMVSY